MTKEYMMQVFQMDKQVQKLSERLEYLKFQQTKPTSSQIGLGVQTSRNITSAQDLTIKVLEAEEALNKAVEQLTQLEWEIVQAYAPLSPRQKAIIIWRYICRLPWKEIAKRAKLSEMQVMRIHNTSLDILAENKNRQTQGLPNSLSDRHFNPL